MAEPKDGGLAFPHPGSTNEHGNVVVYPELGMSLRDYFAGQALAAIVSNNKMLDEISDANRGGDMDRHVAAGAYALADAMLAERAK